jgi:hypothetical protein
MVQGWDYEKGGDFYIKIVGFWGGKKVNFCRYIMGGDFYLGVGGLGFGGKGDL